MRMAAAHWPRPLAKIGRYPRNTLAPRRTEVGGSCRRITSGWDWRSTNSRWQRIHVDSLRRKFNCITVRPLRVGYLPTPCSDALVGLMEKKRPRLECREHCYLCVLFLGDEGPKGTHYANSAGFHEPHHSACTMPNFGNIGLSGCPPPHIGNNAA